MPPYELLYLMQILHVVSAVSVVCALVLAIKLFMETDKVWYWFSLLLSALFFALSEWIIVLMPVLRSFDLIVSMQEMCDILAILFFAASCYGIYRTMKDIRKRVE
jgi:hypothetical protein